MKEWISVKDRLPKSKKEITCGVGAVIKSDKKMIVSLSGYTNEDGFAIEASGLWKVIYYFVYPPLPEPPEVKE